LKDRLRRFFIVLTRTVKFLHRSEPIRTRSGNGYREANRPPLGFRQLVQLS